MAYNKMQLGLSPLTGRIYLGRQKNGHWIGEKRDVTSDFIQVMLQKFEPNTCSDITMDGEPKYKIVIIDSSRVVTVDGKQI